MRCAVAQVAMTLVMVIDSVRGCLTCPFPTSTLTNESCDAFGISASVAALATISAVVVVIYGIASYLAFRDRLATMYFTVLPMLDFVSDVVYVCTVVYAKESVFYLSLLFTFVVPAWGLFGEMQKRDMQPAFIIPFPGYHLSENIIFLSYEEGTPYVNGEPSALSLGFDEDGHDNIIKFIWLGIRWLIWISAQVLFLVCFGVWLAVHFCWLALVLCVGMVLYLTKALCVKRVWNAWTFAWSFDYSAFLVCIGWADWIEHPKVAKRLSRHYKDCERTDTDAGMFQESLVHETVYESIPQLLLQGLNNILTGTWSDPINIFSFVCSACTIVNILYSVQYQVNFKQVAVAHIPLKTRLPCLKEPLEIAIDDESSVVLTHLTRTKSESSS